jgi:dihydroorotase
MGICIRGGRLIDPASNTDAMLDLYLGKNRIVGVGSAPDGFVVDQEIDASGLLVCPGLVDLSARLREPGLEHKATIASETEAAVSAGITSLCCPPDTLPVVDTPAVAELVRRRAKQAGKARVLPLAALTQGLRGEQLTEMAALKAEGCVGVSNAEQPIANSEVLRRAMEYAATHELTVFLAPRDPWLGRQGCMHEGSISTRLGLAGIPETCETVALARDLLLVEQTGVRAHICRLSSARAVEMVAEAQARGLPVTADVAAHQLHLTDAEVHSFDGLYHVLPPLRTRHDRAALRQGLAAGTITAICSDHQPHEPDAKLAPFGDTEPGISALETLFPLALRLVAEGALGLPTLVARLTAGPAAVLGSKAGALRVGAIADICLVDLDQRWTLTADGLRSRGHNTPFLGQELRGRVRQTLVGGRTVFTLDSSH